MRPCADTVTGNRPCAAEILLRTSAAENVTEDASEAIFYLRKGEGALECFIAMELAGTVHAACQKLVAAIGPMSNTYISEIPAKSAGGPSTDGRVQTAVAIAPYMPRRSPVTRREMIELALDDLKRRLGCQG